jgi:hypothetical protein
MPNSLWGSTLGRGGGGGGGGGGGEDLNATLVIGNATSGQDIVVSAGDVCTLTDLPTADTDAANKLYVDQLVAGLDWQESVLDRLTTPPGGPVLGARYLIIAVATGAWVGREDDIAEWDGAAWVYTTPNPGFAVYVEAENRAYVWNGSAWVRFASILEHNNLASLQGGTATERYHLTSAQQSTLTAGAASDASGLHNHDTQYDWDGIEVVYVGKHGSDADDGLSYRTAKLTFGSAITAAVAAAPSAGNRIAIVCEDGGLYSENLVLPQYVSIFAPNATLDSAGASNTLLINSDCEAHFRRIVQSAGGPAAIVKTNTSGTARVYADIIELTSGTTCIINFGVTATLAVLIVQARTIFVNAVGGFGVGDASNEGHIHVFAEDIYLAANNTVGVLRGAATADTTIVRVGHILETGSPTGTVGVSVTGGEVDIIADLINADTALSTGVSGTINGLVSDVQGTIVKTGDLRVQIGRAAPISGAGAPGGVVTGFFGQIYEDTGTGDFYLCDSDPSGTSWTALATGPAGATNSFPGIQQSLFVDKGTVTGSEDGTVQNPYHTVGAAVTAANGLTPGAANRIGIFVYPGIYVESLSTQDDYVDFIGFDRQTTIIRQSGAVVPLAINDRNMSFRNLTFECAAGSTANITSVPGGVIADPIYFYDCDFLGTAGAATSFFLDSQLTAEYHRCAFIQGSTDLPVYQTSGSSRDTKFFDCQFDGVFHLQGLAQIEVFSSTFVSSADATWGGTLRMQASSARIALNGCTIKSTDAAGYPVWLQTANVDLGDFSSCTFDSASARDIHGSAICTIGVYGCSMSQGMTEFVRTRNKIKYAAGEPGDADYYIGLAEAVNSLSSLDDDCTIYILNDYTTASTVSQDQSIKVTIDGLDKRWIDSSPATGSVLLCSAGVNILRNVRFTGNLTTQGAGTETILDGCRVDGRVTMGATGSDASTLIVIHDTKVLGSASLPTAVDIASALPSMIISQSHLKGVGGAAAVDYQDNINNNLKFEYSKVFHGSLGANNPFTGMNDPDQAIYNAHHCVFNAEPDLAEPLRYQNDIDLGQRQNTIDPDGDYHWQDW